MLDLKQSVQYIKGVGPNRAALLNKLGIFTLEDLITYFPRTYEDRDKPKKIIDVVDGEDNLIEDIIENKYFRELVKNYKVILVAVNMYEEK